MDLSGDSTIRVLKWAVKKLNHYQNSFLNNKQKAEGEETVVAEEQEKVEEEEEFHSDIEVEGEDYIPPGGMFVPGLYSPPNELAKANGLAFFYPKV